MRLEDLLAKPCTWFPSDSQVNGTATATKAGVTNWTHYIAGISVSCSGQPASAVQVLIQDGATVIDQWEIPATAFSPIVVALNRPYQGSVGNAVSVSVGAMGSGVRGTVSIRGFSGQV